MSSQNHANESTDSILIIEDIRSVPITVGPHGHLGRGEPKKRLVGQGRSND